MAYKLYLLVMSSSDIPPNCKDLRVAAFTALIVAFLRPFSSNAYTPAMLVPPGEHTGDCFRKKKKSLVRISFFREQNHCPLTLILQNGRITSSFEHHFCCSLTRLGRQQQGILT